MFTKASVGNDASGVVYPADEREPGTASLEPVVAAAVSFLLSIRFKTMTRCCSSLFNVIVSMVTFPLNS